MTLKAVLKERGQKRRALRQDAIDEAKRLAVILKKKYQFESIYITGSILSDRFGSSSDIDLVIKGLKREEYFKVFSFLIKESTHSVDLKPFEDLADDFKERIVLKGVKIG